MDDEELEKPVEASALPRGSQGGYAVNKGQPRIGDRVRSPRREEELSAVLRVQAAQRLAYFLLVPMVYWPSLAVWIPGTGWEVDTMLQLERGAEFMGWFPGRL
jgi:hypothetical protein